MHNVISESIKQVNILLGWFFSGDFGTEATVFYRIIIDHETYRLPSVLTTHDDVLLLKAWLLKEFLCRDIHHVTINV